MVKLKINGTLPGLNEYVEQERRNRFAGASFKKRAQHIVVKHARALGKWRPEGSVYMVYNWHEPNRRRDKDNISSFGRKVIQDGLVEAGVLPNDGWKDIRGFEDRFFVDKKNPRIVVEIYDEETEGKENAD